MKGKRIAYGLGIALAVAVMPVAPAKAQKFIHISAKSGHATAHVRVHKFGRLVSGVRRKGLPRVRFSIFALPDQTLFPPYYQAQRPWSDRPDMESRLEGGKTAEQGSRWASHIEGGRTVEQGSRWRSHNRGGRTVEGGSRWASHITPGRTVEQGSRWGSAMANWRFSATAAPMRPKGIPYFRAARRRSPWASRAW